MHVSYIVAAVVFLPNKHVSVANIWQVTVVNLIYTVHNIIIVVSSFILAFNLALNFNDCTMEFQNVNNKLRH